MLLAAFKNIMSLFGLRWRVFFNVFGPVNVYCSVLLTNSWAKFRVCQCGSYWNVPINGHSLFILFLSTASRGSMTIESFSSNVLQKPPWVKQFLIVSTDI
ncbi:hypothetical protein AVEN_231157-1 [Araneus ventricosus]|uniref:Uncharacterized protein n=1 Tax=Araneus ventricosus TaxID=182803 RepID=A0A4Y2LJJ2_ARAVE|nr:hypothetical protein AVEN_231157-1 [Araneus ventricosus]